MRSLAIVISLVIAAAGVLGIAAPPVLLDAARFSVTPVGLYVAAALRITFGLVLLRVAPISRAPRILRVLGAFIVVAGIITPFLGVERASAAFQWWSTQGTAFISGWAALAVVFGLSIIYAVAPWRLAA